MPTIEVELDDLEALIYASAAIKNIEGALASYRRDPFVNSMGGKFLPAQKRLEDAVRNAKRGIAHDTAVKFNEPLRSDEATRLKELYCSLMPSGVGPLRDDAAAGSLAAKGMIEIGTKVSGAVWPGQDVPALQKDPTALIARLTDRGVAEATRIIKAGSLEKKSWVQRDGPLRDAAAGWPPEKKSWIQSLMGLLGVVNRR